MIDAQKANYTVTRMCRLLGVDRRRYYEWRRRRAAGPGRGERRMAELAAKIRAHHEASDGTYGAPRILHDLREAGETVSRKTVAKARVLSVVQLLLIVVCLWGLSGGEPGTLRGDHGDAIASGAGLVILILLGPVLNLLFDRAPDNDNGE